MTDRRHGVPTLSKMDSIYSRSPILSFARCFLPTPLQGFLRGPVVYPWSSMPFRRVRHELICTDLSLWAERQYQPIRKAGRLCVFMLSISFFCGFIFINEKQSSHPELQDAIPGIRLPSTELKCTLPHSTRHSPTPKNPDLSFHHIGFNKKGCVQHLFCNTTHPHFLGEEDRTIAESRHG